MFALERVNDSVPRIAMSRFAAARKFVVIEKRPEPHRSLRGWAVGLLLETGDGILKGRSSPPGIAQGF